METELMTEFEYVTRREFDQHAENQRGILEHINDSLEAMWTKIDGRPSWAVLLIITFLTSALGITITYILSK